nr:FAD-dependent oxidoreductase [Bacteroidota bacterium]
MKPGNNKVIDPICNMAIDKEHAIVLKLDETEFYFCSEGCKNKFQNKRSNTASDESEPSDLIIIGGGPAGLTACVYASILRMKAFLITDNLGGQAIDSTKIENYMGFDFITGPELIQKFHYQLLNSHYIDHLLCEVELIIPIENKGFMVITSKRKKFFTKTILIASGMKRRELNVPGEEKFQRKGLFYGNIQDMSYVQNKNVVIIGGGNSALQMVENLHKITKKVFLVSDTILTGDAIIIERIRTLSNLEIFEEYKVEKFIGNKILTAVQIRKKGDKETNKLPVSGAFVAIGLRPDTSLVFKYVDLNEKGEIIINQDCSTSYPGIFAAGDVTNVFGKRIIIASGEGAKAALAVRKFLIDMNKKI